MYLSAEVLGGGARGKGRGQAHSSANPKRRRVGGQSVDFAAGSTLDYAAQPSESMPECRLVSFGPRGPLPLRPPQKRGKGFRKLPKPRPSLLFVSRPGKRAGRTLPTEPVGFRPQPNPLPFTSPRSLLSPFQD